MKRMFTVVAALFLLAAISPASAQKKDKTDTKNRTVQGVVTDDAESPAEGAVVQLKDTKSLQIRSFITKANGTYHFNGLSPDIDYELKAEHKGIASSPKTLSSFDNRRIAVINLKVNK